MLPAVAHGGSEHQLPIGGRQRCARMSRLLCGLLLATTGHALAFYPTAWRGPVPFRQNGRKACSPLRAGTAGSAPAPRAAACHILVDSEGECRALKNELDAFIGRRSPVAPKLVVDILGLFSQLARTHSTCPSGVESGGVLGEFSQGKMTKPFDDLVFNTGEVDSLFMPTLGQ